MDDELGFRGNGALVDSTADKQKRKRYLPRFRPPEGNTLLPTCLILIIVEDYNDVVWLWWFRLDLALGRLSLSLSVREPP
jgi:hypothetical protein